VTRKRIGGWRLERYHFWNFTCQQRHVICGTPSLRDSWMGEGGGWCRRIGDKAGGGKISGRRGRLAPGEESCTATVILLYPVQVTLAKTCRDVGPRQVALGPGMSASVEIKTETRRVIEYLLSSLQRYQHEAMRER